MLIKRFMFKMVVCIGHLHEQITSLHSDPFHHRLVANRACTLCLVWSWTHPRVPNALAQCNPTQSPLAVPCALVTCPWQCHVPSSHAHWKCYVPNWQNHWFLPHITFRVNRNIGFYRIELSGLREPLIFTV